MGYDTRIDDGGSKDLGHDVLEREVTWATKNMRRDAVMIPYQSITEEKEEMDYRFPQIIGITGEEAVFVKNIIQELIDKVIKLVDEVMEVYEDKIARDSTFTLVEENIILIWKKRKQVNNHFKGVLVYLLTAIKNSFYQNYEKEHYESIKAVLEKLRKINITSAQEKECVNLLGDSGIDLIAPLRDWEKYTIEIKKVDENK